MKKKLMSLLMAMVLILGVASPSFAAGMPGGEEVEPFNNRYYYVTEYSSPDYEVSSTKEYTVEDYELALAQEALQPGRNHAQSAQRVKVAQRIHGQATHILGGGIAQFPADKRVGGFMERDDDQHGHGAQSVIIQLLRGDHAIEGKMIHKNLSIPHSRPHRHIRVII